MPRVTLLFGGGGMGRIIEKKMNPLCGFVCFALIFMFLASPAFAAGTVRVGRITEKESYSSVQSSIAYPNISGISDTKQQNRLNVAFMEMAKTFRTKAEYEAKSGTVNANMDYKVMRNQDGVMSLVVKESINSGRGQDVSQIGVTIDTVTGRRYLISDLFIENADYVDTISDYINSKQRNKSDASFVKVSENADYYLTRDAIVLFFKQGENTNKECAVKEFAIPLKTLKGILKPQFVV